MKLLYTAEEARAIIGIGEKAFRRAGVPARRVRGSLRKVYHIDDLNEFTRNLEKVNEPCQSVKGRGRPTTNTISQSKECGFEEALKRTIMQQRAPSRRSTKTMLSVVPTIAGNPA